VVKALEDKNILWRESADGLLKLIGYGYAAAHGASVEPGIAFSAALQSERVLKSVDDIIEALRLTQAGSEDPIGRSDAC
jgi:hypothetical protein